VVLGIIFEDFDAYQGIENTLDIQSMFCFDVTQPDNDAFGAMKDRTHAAYLRALFFFIRLRNAQCVCPDNPCLIC
jgi:hypothetical protein